MACALTQFNKICQLYSSLVKITRLVTVYYDLFSAVMWPIAFIMECLFFGCIIYGHILCACTYTLYILFSSVWIPATFFLCWVSRSCLSHSFPPFYCSSFYFWTIKTRGTAPGPFLTTSHRQWNGSGWVSSHSVATCFNPIFYSLPPFLILKKYFIYLIIESPVASASLFKAVDKMCFFSHCCPFSTTCIQPAPSLPTSAAYTLQSSLWTCRLTCHHSCRNSVSKVNKEINKLLLLHKVFMIKQWIKTLLFPSNQQEESDKILPQIFYHCRPSHHIT